MVVEAVRQVNHHAVEGEPEELGCGSAGSAQLDETDGGGLREAAGSVAERAPVEAVLGTPVGERSMRGAPVCKQLRGFVLGDAAAGGGHGDLRSAKSLVVGRSGPSNLGGLNYIAGLADQAPNRTHSGPAYRSLR